MSTAKQDHGLATVEELFTIPSEQRYEIVSGVLIAREGVGGQHGHIGMSLSARLWLYVRERNLGFVFGPDTTFYLARNPDTVRIPDIAFVRKSRLPFGVPEKQIPFAPDFAVEVLSPNNRPGEMSKRIADLFQAGTKLIWVIDPKKRCATMRHANGDTVIVREGDYLDGGEVIPGFRVQVMEVLHA